LASTNGRPARTRTHRIASVAQENTMNIQRIVLLLALCAPVVVPLPGHDARAATAGTTLAGRAYVSGGVTQDEREALAAQRGRYALEVITAARGSGAYLAGVRVRVTDESGRTVLDTMLDGPWLLVDLAPGRYRIDAVLGGTTQSRTVAIPAGGHREAYFYFDVEAEVAPRAAGG
jgi:hypothetical protein